MLFKSSWLIKLINKRDTSHKASKAAIQMNKVKKLDTSQFKNTKISKSLVKMMKTDFQVTLNSKIKCKKRSNKTI